MRRSLGRAFYRSQAALAEAAISRSWKSSAFAESLAAQDVRILWPRRYVYPSAYVWVDQIRDGLKRILPLRVGSVEQAEGRPQVCFRFVRDGTAHDACLDYLDTNEIDLEFAKRFTVYFKMQFRREGYGLDHIVPGGYTLRRVSDYLRLPELREMADRRDYRFGVHGRFGFNPRRANHDLRLKAVDMLRKAGYPSFSGTLERVGKRAYMEEIAQSRLCIDLFGHGFLCARLVEYLSVGACIVAPRNPNRLIEPLIDGEHIAFVEPDLSDLVERCEYYLENEEERWAMVQRSRAYFDAHLHRDRVVEYYVRELLERTRPDG